MRLFGFFSLRTKRVVYAVSLIMAVVVVVVGYMSVSLSFVFHAYVAVGFAVGLFFPSIIVHLENRRKRLIDNAWPVLLDNLAESQAVGLTLLQGLEDVSRRNYGPVTEELRKLTAKLTFGVEFEKAFLDFSKRIGTEFSAKVSALIVEAVRLGGDLKSSFNSTAQFVREMIEVRDERESQLRPYLFIIYISFFVFVGIIVLLYQSLFVPMAQSQQTQFLNITISFESFRALLFDLAIVEAIFGGLAAGKLSEGIMLNGLKHSVVMLIIVTVIFTFLL